MKAPKLKDLGTSMPDDEFSKTVEEQAEKASASVRKTFSLQQLDMDYINAQALKLSQKAGKVVSASEALRTIIQRDMGAKS